MPKVLHLSKRQVINRCMKLCHESMVAGIVRYSPQGDLKIIADGDLALAMSLPETNEGNDIELKLELRCRNEARAWMTTAEVVLLNPFRMPVKKTADTCTMNIYSNRHGNHALWTIITINREGYDGKITLQTLSAQAVTRKPRTRK